MSQYWGCNFKQAEWTQWALKDRLCHQWQKASEMLMKPKEMDQTGVTQQTFLLSRTMFIWNKLLKTQNVQFHKSYNV